MTTVGRSKSSNQKLRVKAKKSPGYTPWGTNMMAQREENRQRQGGVESREVNVETRAERCSVN